MKLRLPKVPLIESVVYGACVILALGLAFAFLRANPSPPTSTANMKPVSPPRASEDESPASDGTSLLRTRIERVLRETSTPGAGVAIVRRQDVEWISGLGLADVGAGVATTPDTLFRLGSTSKIFVALAALKLEAEGKLRLEDPLRERAPDLLCHNAWEATDPVRIVHLLEHTSGWDDLPLKAFSHRPEVEQPMRPYFSLWQSARVTRWKPGTWFFYSNAGTAAAAHVVENVAGEPYENYVQRTFFHPLGMKTATFWDSPERDRIAAQQYRGDGRTPFPYWRLVTRPAGGMSASPRDMANLLRFFLNRGEFAGQRILPEASLLRMQKPTSTLAAREGLGTGYGLCLYSDVKEGRLYFGHAGAVLGGLAELAFIPELEAGYIVMINSGNQKAFGRIGALLRAHLTRKTGAPPSPAAVTVPGSVAENYNGWYELATLRTDVKFSRPFTLSRLKVTADGITWGPLGAKHRFIAVGERSFRTENSPVPTMALVANDDDRLVQFTRIPGTTFRRIPTWWAWTQITVFYVAAGLCITTFLYALAWLPRWWLGKFRSPGQFSLRALPLLAALCLVALIIVYRQAAKDLEAVMRLGGVTPWSLALCFLTSVFPLFAGVSLMQSLRLRKTEPGRAAWWHSFLTSCAIAAIGGYLVVAGAFGLRTWA